MLTFHQSYDIRDYGQVLDALIPDFGHAHLHATLAWCDILDAKKSGIWEVYLAKDYPVSETPTGLVKGEAYTVGYCGFYEQCRGSGELWLTWFGIIPQYRGRGYGHQCINILKRRAKLLGATSLLTYIHKDLKVLGFYESLGFKSLMPVGQYVDSNPGLRFDDNFEDRDDLIIKTVL